MSNILRAGASQIEITPEDSPFLFGYPHVARYSTGVHDPLYSSALYLSDGQVKVMFVIGKFTAIRLHGQEPNG